MQIKTINNKLRIIFDGHADKLFAEQVLGLDQNKSAFVKAGTTDITDNEGRTETCHVIDLYMYKPQKNDDPRGPRKSHDDDEPEIVPRGSTRPNGPMFDDDEYGQEPKNYLATVVDDRNKPKRTWENRQPQRRVNSSNR